MKEDKDKEGRRNQNKTKERKKEIKVKRYWEKKQGGIKTQNRT